MFSKFFRKKENSYTIDQTNYLLIFKSIIEYFEQNDKYNYQTKIKGSWDVCELNYYLIPNAFDLEEQLIPNGINSYEELYNIIAEKINFSKLDSGFFDDNYVNYLHLNFKTQNPENKFQMIHHDFLIFCGYQDSEEINVYEVLYSSKFNLDYIDFWKKSEVCTFFLPINSDHAEALEVIDDVLLGFCQLMGIKNLDRMFVFPDEKVIYEINEQLYIDLLKRINPLSDDADILKRAKKLYKKIAIKQNADEGDNVDLLLEFCYLSDWKFEFEDIEDLIAAEFEEPINIQIPDETYSADLFPYIQTFLKENGKVLMNYNSFSDSYYFFIIDLKDVEEVLTMAHFANLNIEVVDVNS